MAKTFSKKTFFTDAELHEKVPFGETFVGYFTRREKTKQGDKQYYLYSSDWENLLLSGIWKNKKFIISKSAFFEHFVDNSPLYIAASKLTGKTYNFITKSFSPLISISMHSIGEKSSLCRHLTVRIFDKNNQIIEEPKEELIEQRMPKLEGGNWVLRFPVFAGISSEKNIILDYRGQYCFVFEKLHDDEFYFSVRYPLSVEQGFAIALTLMRKFITE